MNIIELAQEHFGHSLFEKSPGIWNISPTTGSDFDSVVIWEETNSYYRFSTRKSGGPREFLKYIVGLEDDEIREILGNEEYESDSLLSFMLRENNRKKKNDTGYSTQDVVGTKGYNEYIASRNVSRETAEKYNFEIKDGNVYIPLYDIDGRRTGSIIRNTHTTRKDQRYTTHMIGNYEKPHMWPYSHLHQADTDTIIILVEGAWSVARISQVIGDKAINTLPMATLGTRLTEEMYKYLYEYPIIAIIDDDQGGEHVIEQLTDWRDRGMNVEFYVPKGKDSSIPLYVDDMNDDELKNLFNNINQVTEFTFKFKEIE